MFTDMFGTPRGHPKSKPFIDRVMSFHLVDGKIWVRNYQVRRPKKKKKSKAAVVVVPLFLFRGAVKERCDKDNFDLVQKTKINTIPTQQQNPSIKRCWMLPMATSAQRPQQRTQERSTRSWWRWGPALCSHPSASSPDLLADQHCEFGSFDTSSYLPHTHTNSSSTLLLLFLIAAAAGATSPI
jgi:hypothetical protein